MRKVSILRKASIVSVIYVVIFKKNAELFLAKAPHLRAKCGGFFCSFLFPCGTELFCAEEISFKTPQMRRGCKNGFLGQNMSSAFLDDLRNDSRRRRHSSSSSRCPPKHLFACEIEFFIPQLQVICGKKNAILLGVSPSSCCSFCQPPCPCCRKLASLSMFLLQLV